MADVPDIVEVDEEGDIENGEGRPDHDHEHRQAAERSAKKEEHTPQHKEVPVFHPLSLALTSFCLSQLNMLETPDALDESVRSSGNRMKRERSADRNKVIYTRLFLV